MGSKDFGFGRPGFYYAKVLRTPAIVPRPVKNCLTVFIGCCVSPTELPHRILLFTAALTSALLYSAYTGAFVASVSTPPANIQSLDALKKQGFTIFGDPDLTTYSEDFIQVIAFNSFNHSYRLILSRSPSVLHNDLYDVGSQRAGTTREEFKIFRTRLHGEHSTESA